MRTAALAKWQELAFPAFLQTVQCYLAIGDLVSGKHVRNFLGQEITVGDDVCGVFNLIFVTKGYESK